MQPTSFCALIPFSIAADSAYFIALTPFKN
jgi:hypothetical protein